MEGNNKNIVFLTKSGILRNYSSISECREEHFFYVGKKAITMFNKTAKISDNKFINVLSLIKHSKKFEKNVTNTNSSDSSSFYDYYFQNFAKNKVFITIRDIVEYVFMVVVAFFSKTSIKVLLKLF